MLNIVNFGYAIVKELTRFLRTESSVSLSSEETEMRTATTPPSTFARYASTYWLSLEAVDKSA